LGARRGRPCRAPGFACLDQWRGRTRGRLFPGLLRPPGASSAVGPLAVFLAGAADSFRLLPRFLFRGFLVTAAELLVADRARSRCDRDRAGISPEHARDTRELVASTAAGPRVGDAEGWTFRRRQGPPSRVHFLDKPKWLAPQKLRLWRQPNANRAFRVIGYPGRRPPAESGSSAPPQSSPVRAAPRASLSSRHRMKLAVLACCTSFE
jgi:hypothetical protein